MRTAAAAVRLPSALPCNPLLSARALSSPSLPAARAGAAARMLSSGPDRTVVGTCKSKIEAALSPSELEVTGAFDDPNGSHITVYCVSEQFEGKRSMARQQMVFKAIWEEMAGAPARARARRAAAASQPHPRAPPPRTNAGTSAPVHAVDTMVLKAPSEL